MQYPYNTPTAAGTAPARMEAYLAAISSAIIAPTDIPVTYILRSSTQNLSCTSASTVSKNIVSLEHDAETQGLAQGWPAGTMLL